MKPWRIWPLISALLLFNLVPQPQYSYSAAVDVPSNVTAFGSSNASFGNGTITVNWSEVSGATAYSVRATRSGTSEAVLASVAGQKNTKLVVSALTGGAQYVVQVRTIKIDEVSAWSSDSLVITPLTKPKAPQKPSAVPLTGGATVSWVLLTESENGGSPVTSYVVTETRSAKSKSVGPNSSSTSFADLADGEKASFTVAAITDVDKGGTVSVASDEITIGSAGTASPSPTPTPSSIATPSASPTSSSSSGGGTIGGSSGGSGNIPGASGGGGGGGAVKQTALYFKIVDPLDDSKVWSKRGCVSIYSRDLFPQFMGSGCADDSGNINVLAGDAKVIVRVYELGYGDKYRSYIGEIANDLFTLEAKFFPGTTRYAVSVAIDAPPVKPTPTPVLSTNPIPTPTPTVTPTPSLNPTPTPTPTPTLSLTPSISATPSASPTPTVSKPTLIATNSFISIGTKRKSVEIAAKKSSYTLKVGTQARITWSGLSKSSSVQLSIRTPARKTYRIPAIKIKTTSFTTPKLQFKKKGTYNLVINFAKNSRKITILVR